VGVDNVDIQAATRRGVLVLNAPEGNTTSTAEHTCALIMSMARQVSRANASLRSGSWDRKSFVGSELYGKTLGIVGFGKIGRAVATRMAAFGMRVITADPLVAPTVAERMNVEAVTLDDLFVRSDIITLHTPLTDQTKGLLDADALRTCRKGVRIVNCARGGIVNEADLLAALEEGHVAGAALDVYSTEPPSDTIRKLLQHPAVIGTPHIAASTDEAQQKVARQVTEQVIRALKGEPVQTAVNSVAIRMAGQTEVQPFLELAEMLGKVSGQLIDGSITTVSVRSHGELMMRYSELLTIGCLKGLLSMWSDHPVNYINARMIAEEAGLRVEEQRLPEDQDYTNLLEVSLQSSLGSILVGGAVFGRKQPRIVRVDEYDFELQPGEYTLFYRNPDRPGMLASVGLILAESGVNIGALALGRKGRGLVALTAVNVDEQIPDEILNKIGVLEGVEDVKMVVL
jgi:D-3-phosphoglycerate dehydrogenase